MLIPLKGAGGGRIQKRDNVGIVVADRVQLVKPGVVGVVHVIIALVTGGEAPAAVPVAIRLLPVAVANLAALHRDAVGGDAAIGPSPVGEQILHVLRLHMVAAVAASGLVQLLSQRRHLMGHLLDLLIAHQIVEVIGQGSLGEICQSLVHSVVLLCRGCDTDAAGGGVILVQIMEVYPAADTTLQQDSGQISDDINGEVKVDLHAIGVGELKILHRLVEVPVLLVQPDLGKDFAEGDLLFLLVLQKRHKVQTVIGTSNKVAPVFADIHPSCLLLFRPLIAVTTADEVIVQALKIVVGIGFTILIKLQPIQIHHLIDICKGIMDTRNVFVLKYFSQHFSLRWCQCGEKIVFCLVVIRLGETIALDPPGRHAVFTLHKAVNKCFIQFQLLAHGRSSIPKQFISVLNSRCQ